MHGRLRESIKRHASVRENVGLVLVGIAFFTLLILADRAGMPRKWHTAIYGTVGPFGVVIAYSPSYWRRWSFWLTIVVCFALHALAIFGLFEYVFTKTIYPGLLIWTPVVFVETFALLIAVLRVERNLARKKEREIGS